MTFNPPLDLTITKGGVTNHITITSAPHTWHDSPEENRLLVEFPGAGLPSAFPVFIGKANYPAGWTEEQAQAQVQAMANSGAIAALFNPVVKPPPAPGSITPPARPAGSKAST